MSIKNFLASMAPYAIGAFFPAGLPAIAAGAVTGAAMAKTKDQDPLLGAVTGGLGGYGGSQLGQGLKTFGAEQAAAGIAGTPFAPVLDTTQFVSPTLSNTQALTAGVKGAFNRPMDFFKSYGKGDTMVGALKTGSIGLPAVAGAFQPDYNKDIEDKYNPYQRLNLNRNTGLRLLEQGGYIESGGTIGDGMSDEIMGRIDNTQPVRLSDGEFVIPADVVSHLGNGSSDAGAERLYTMMDAIRKARTGNERQGKEIIPERFIPV